MSDPLAEHNSQERTPAERKKQMLRKLPGKKPQENINTSRLTCK